MERNIKIIIIAGMFSALILGFFEILFPFYLSYRGISLADMGLIFSVSTLAIALFRVFLGEYTDVYGRKRVYLASSALSATTKSIFPFFFGKIFVAKHLPILHLEACSLADHWHGQHGHRESTGRAL